VWGIRLGGLGPFFYVPAKMRHARRLFAKFSQFSPGQIERGSARDKVLRNTNKSWNALNRVFGLRDGLIVDGPAPTRSDTTLHGTNFRNSGGERARRVKRAAWTAPLK
jgi:hypothetical protein